MELVRAAGGVVWRRSSSGPEVLVIHRPRYDDWSLPKGKLDAGETFEEAAVREVVEEVGITVVLGPELPERRYVDHRGRPKVVRYWSMEVGPDVDGLADEDEVDDLRWVPGEEAGALLSYEGDRHVLSSLLALVTER